MTPDWSQRKTKRYRYYVCTRAQKEGWTACPSPSIPAGPMEEFVIDQIGAMGTEHDADFKRSWNTLSSSEQHRLIRRLTRQVVYDGQTGQVSISVDSEKMRSLAQGGDTPIPTSKGVSWTNN